MAVWYLQSMNVAAGHTLTLDGQADTDYYTIYTTGSRATPTGVRNYVINILDTGAPNDGVDEAAVYGIDNSEATYNGASGLNDDLFLLRASTCIPKAGGYDCTKANETTNGPAFVALLHGSVDTYADTSQGNEPSTSVQRVNYDRALNGRLSVFGLSGNDHFYVDDTTTTIALDGGAGFDTFQIGQIFGTKRDQALGGVRPQDLFPDLIPTTRGWLSPGTHAPLVATGGTGNDQFTVYSNQAELRLEGDDDNDLFVVRAFALAVVQSTNPNTWTDDTIVLDAHGVASPRIGAGYSTGRPLDIRTGGGEDEVQYNVNAPVSVDGGTGIDKLVILATEFADDIVITARGIYGGGLNVRYSTIEIVEVDGLEGDDEFFVQSTAFGVAYRVIGGLGSDTINVAGDITEDIVVRELEGLSGAINHLVRSSDVGYDGLPVAGIETNIVREDSGLVLITETEGFTAVREGGPVSVDAYAINLARAPSATVFVTISAARAPQEEADDATTVNTANLAQKLATGNGDTVWLCTGVAATDCDSPTEFRRYVYRDGVLTPVDNRGLVLTFTTADYATPQWVYVYAVDEFADTLVGTPNSELDARAEGDRVAVIQHTVISADSDFNGTAVRNVEVTVRDNDTPGVYVIPVTPTTGSTTEDGRTLVIEGKNDPSVGGVYTGQNDQVLVQLAMDPGAGVTIKVALTLDADSAEAISLSSADSRWDVATATITFTGGAGGTWNTPLRLLVKARDDDRVDDPQIAIVAFGCGSATTCGTASSYRIPNLRSGTGRLDVEVIDDESPGLVTVESGGSTIVVDDDPATPGVDESTLVTSQDTYTIRLTKRPDGTVTVAVLTDGLTDVVSVNSVPVVLQTNGGNVPTQLFHGQVTIADTTVTRGSDSDFGSFIEEGFALGQFVRVTTGSGTLSDPYLSVDASITALTAQAMGLTQVGSLTGTDVTAAISRLVRQGLWTGAVSTVVAAEPSDPAAMGGRRITRTDSSGWLADGFLEGQRVRVTNEDTAEYVDLKIAVIRGTNALKDNTLQFTREGTTPTWWTGNLRVSVNRLAAVATFTTTNWYVAQTVALKADPTFALPLVREGAKTFPATPHLLSNLRGPLSVEGGVTGADRSLKNGVKLPGEKDGALFGIASQAPESRQIDVLNIFNDSSQADGSGVMTSTTVSGFGMANDLEFTGSNPFGEPLSFPGGISFGTISFDGTNYGTDAAKTTIEVLNILLGSGNDTLDIQGTLDPAQAVSAVGRFSYGSTTITRTGPVSWRDLGFLPGQTLTISGVTESWTISAISADGLGADPRLGRCPRPSRSGRRPSPPPTRPCREPARQPRPPLVAPSAGPAAAGPRTGSWPGNS